MDKCTRGFYEESVHIRDAKLLAAREGFDSLIGSLKPTGKSDANVAVVGRRPAAWRSAICSAGRAPKSPCLKSAPSLAASCGMSFPASASEIMDGSRRRSAQSHGRADKDEHHRAERCELKKSGFTQVVFATARGRTANRSCRKARA